MSNRAARSNDDGPFAPGRRSRAAPGFKLVLCGVLSALLSCPVSPPRPQACEVEGTGCGPFFLGPLVPLYANCFEAGCSGDTAVVCFTCACNVHDVCYGTCGEAKEQCDQDFLEDMLALCGDSPAVGCEFSTCEERAFVYAVLVAAAGDFSFDTAQAAACDPEAPAARKGPVDPRSTGTVRPRRAVPYEDADGDLLPDRWERSAGLDPEYRGDALEDFDGDGLWNLGEFMANTDPYLVDSDGDGVDDAGELRSRNRRKPQGL